MQCPFKHTIYLRSQPSMIISLLSALYYTYQTNPTNRYSFKNDLTATSFSYMVNVLVAWFPWQTWKLHELARGFGKETLPYLHKGLMNGTYTIIQTFHIEPLIKI